MTKKNDSIKKVYDEISDTYAATFSEPSEHIDEFLTRVKPKGNILDVGCGPGVDSAYMISQGFRVIGVDVSEKMLVLAKEKNSQVIFEMADMRSLPFAASSFDGILVSFSLIHIPKKDVLQTLRDFNKLLTKGGILYVGIQEGKSEEIYVEEPLKPIKEKLFLNVMSSKELERFLTDSNFEIIEEFSRKAENEGEFNFRKHVIIARGQ